MILSKQIKNSVGEIKLNVKNIHTCPYCHQKFDIGIETSTLKKISEANDFPYAHIHLHGNPLHAMLCYIDKDLIIRSIGVVKSIEVSRDCMTFKQIMKKWSNPY
ncbi:MAG: hypothetical protein ACFFAO_13125 [Candidatus Hermodarchaeota archaeon]